MFWLGAPPAWDETTEESEYWVDVDDKLCTKVPALANLAFLRKLTEDPHDWSVLNEDNLRKLFVQKPPSLFNEKTKLKIVYRGTLGWIAMHYDKRDDDLYPFCFNGDSELEVQVKKPADLDNPIIEPRTIRISKQKRKWCPPVVQQVQISPHQGGNGDSRYITLKISSQITKPRSLQKPYLDEIPWLEELGDAERNILETLLGEKDNNPYEYHFGRPGQTAPYDITIWKVKIFVIEEGVPKKIFEEKMDSFAGTGTCEFSYDWRFDDVPVAEFEKVLSYFTEEGLCDYGTSVILEDLVGHVAPPEEILLSQSG